MFQWDCMTGSQYLESTQPVRWRFTSTCSHCHMWKVVPQPGPYIHPHLFKEFIHFVELYLILCHAVFSCSVMSDSATSWTVAHLSPLSMGILQVRILEWVAMLSSRGSSQPRNGAQVCHFAGESFISWATREDYFFQHTNSFAVSQNSHTLLCKCIIWRSN